MTDFTATLVDDYGTDDALSVHVAGAPYELYSVYKPNTLGDPSFSPDGTHVIYTEHFRSNYFISSIALGATQVQTELFISPNPLADPSFSADGFFILFAEQKVLPSVSFPYGKWRLRYMNADGTGVLTILDDGNANMHPCWVTPTQIAFQHWQYGATPSTAFQIALIDLAGNGRMELGEGEYPRVVEI